MRFSIGLLLRSLQRSPDNSWITGGAEKESKENLGDDDARR